MKPTIRKKKLSKVQEKPQANLGLATTEELLNELRVRIEMDYFSGGGGLLYSTVAGRPESIAEADSSG